MASPHAVAMTLRALRRSIADRVAQGWQEALAALLMDAALRERWIEAPSSALAPFALDSRELAMLAAIPRGTISRQAAMFAGKRTAEVMRFVPLTHRVSPTLPVRYREWLERHPPRAADHAIDPALAEALRALAPLRAELLADDGEATYAGDLLAYEVFSAASRQDGRPRLFASRFALHAIARELATEIVPADPDHDEPHEYRYDAAGIRWRPR
jgi:hypothetical protein